MELADLLNDGDSSSVPSGKIDITGLAADSREVAPGFLFAALPGTLADGTRFIPDACRRGAAAVLAGPGYDAGKTLGIPVITAENPRRALARMAARFYPRQPETVVAVTGTNGKTSVASFVRQLWEQAGLKAASIGTVGVTASGVSRKLAHTTPDPVALHRILDELAGEGIGHVAVEASSHGLAQYRLDGVRVSAAGFTNISRDHLDYHDTLESYLAAKLRLFAELVAPGGSAVVNADSDHAGEVLAAARQAGLTCFTTGQAGRDLKLVSRSRTESGQTLELAPADGPPRSVYLPLVGDFQASNALVAAGLAMVSGLTADEALAGLGTLAGARGRLEKAGETAAGAAIYVDYAHTPDALKTVLTALRPYTRKRLILVFGAGGDRDRGKRPLMGEAAAELSDIAIVTDDNPRGEEPGAIRAEILAAAPDAIEIGDRQTAISAGVRMLTAGDILLVAGKGHEEGQIIGERVVPFSDHEAVAAALEEANGRD